MSTIHTKFYVLFIAAISFVNAFQNPGKSSRYIARPSYFKEVAPSNAKSFRPLRLINNKLRIKMSMVADSETPVAAAIEDFSKFAVGE